MNFCTENDFKMLEEKIKTAALNNKDNKTLLDILQKMKLGINLEAFNNFSKNFSKSLGANGIDLSATDLIDPNQLNEEFID